MNNEITKAIDNIVWFIPNRKLRDSIRIVLHGIVNNNIDNSLNSIKQLISYNCVMNLLKEDRYKDEKRLEKFGYKVFSQNDEDGIINEIFNRIGTTNKFFVEFGVQNGLECNSHYLLMQGWSGVFIEVSEDYCDMIKNNFKSPISSGKLTVLNRFIDAENINNILSETKASDIKEIDLLSIDIDGNDYHVFNAINVINPRVIIIEYNAKFPPPMKWIMPYNPTNIWDGSDKHGASLEAITSLADSKGYQLVGTNLLGVNAFFVRKDLCLNKFTENSSASNLYNAFKTDITFKTGHTNMYFLENAENEIGLNIRAEQSRAEQSRAEQSRAVMFEYAYRKTA